MLHMYVYMYCCLGICSSSGENRAAIFCLLNNTAAERESSFVCINIFFHAAVDYIYKILLCGAVSRKKKIFFCLYK